MTKRKLMDKAFGTLERKRDSKNFEELVYNFQHHIYNEAVSKQITWDMYKIFYMKSKELLNVSREKQTGIEK